VNGFMEEGKYLEAEGILEEALKETTATEEEKEEILRAYEEVRLKILYSRISTPSSIIHTVERGDSLYKIAKKYKTTIGLIKKSNGLSRDIIHPGAKLKVETGTWTIRVDKSDNLLTLYLDKKPIKTFSIATGAKTSETPIGEFKIINKLEDPTWYHAGAVVPADSPENILGTRWLGFDFPGYGIHGTTLPDSIGTHSTAGCVRMFNADVEELYALIPVGSTITITA